MKIVCLIRPAPPLVYFANEIHRRHGVSLVIVEDPAFGKGVIEKLREKTLPGVLETFRDRIESLVKGRQYRQIYREYFRDRWKALDPAIPVRYVRDINSPEVRVLLRQARPDVILDHGTSVVADDIIALAADALNLHWGLSPYYRGTRCTEWALLKRDPLNIGVTIHRLTSRIDGGDIVVQERAVLTPRDTAHSINMRLTKMGTDLVSRVLEELMAGKRLPAVRQDYSKGILTYNHQWNKGLEKKVRFLQRPVVLRDLLRNPAREALSIEEGVCARP